MNRKRKTYVPWKRDDNGCYTHPYIMGHVEKAGEEWVYIPTSESYPFYVRPNLKAAQRTARLLGRRKKGLSE